MKKKNLVFTIIAIVSALLMIVAIVLNNNASLPLALCGATGLFVIGILKWIVGKEEKIFRIIVLTTLYLFLLTYIIPASMFYGGSVSDLGLARMSLYDLVIYPYNTLFLPNSFQALLLILTVGGFYGILEKTGKFRVLLERIAKSLKGNEYLFIGVITFLSVILSSIFGLNLILFAFIPTVLSIVLLLGFDKMTAFLVAFISPLIGVMGSTYSSNIAAVIGEATSTVIKDGLMFRSILLVLAYAVFLFFTVRQAKKSKHKVNEVKEQLELAISEEKSSSKKPVWPIVAVLVTLLVIFILGYTDWVSIFNTDVFSTLLTDITNIEIGGYKVFGFLLNNVQAFGTWSYEYTGVLDYQNAVILLVLASIVLSLVYNIKPKDAFESFAKGVKKVVKPAFLVMIAYTLLFVNGNHSMFATVIEFVLDLFKNTTGFVRSLLFVITSNILTVVSTFLHIDTYYMAQLSTAQIASHFTDLKAALAVITNASHGLAMIFVPTSSMLILGLSYLGISYKEWMKSSWKMLLALLGVIIVVVTCMLIFA